MIALAVGSVLVEKVLKGNPIDATVRIHYYGGMVSLAASHEARQDPPLDEAGLIQSILSFFLRVSVQFDRQVEAKPGQKYLLFLSYTPEEEKYFVL